MKQTDKFPLSTSQFAIGAGCKPESVRARLHKFGSYYGFVPERRENGRLAWPTQPNLTIKDPK
ncbi:MAG: hypothetical protein PHV02_17360 [Rhodocyclaceae bacterium]|nr:hypothetical protein [Rhodocyclaceae bacterium]